MVTTIIDFLLLEKRTYINDNPNIVLFVKDNLYTRDFVLTNPINKAVYGYCSLYNRTALYDEINRAVAVMNYGPLLMDCVLMYEYNKKWCRPSRSIEPDAQKLFKYYLQNRKTELELSKAKDTYTKYMTKDGIYLNNKDVLDIVNTLFKMPPTKEFNEFLNKSKSVQSQTDEKTIVEIFRRGNALYDKYY